MSIFKRGALKKKTDELNKNIVSCPNRLKQDECRCRSYTSTVSYLLPRLTVLHAINCAGSSEKRFFKGRVCLVCMSRLDSGSFQFKMCV